MFDHPWKGRLEIRPPRMLSHRRWGKYSPVIGSAGVSSISCHFYLLLTPVPRSDWHHRWRQRHQTKKEIVIIRIISNFLIFLLIWLISFGSNKRSLPTVRSFWAILWDQFDETYIQILLAFATISLLVSLFGGESYKWIEAISIYFAVLFAGIIQTLCDWGKEKQFLKLRAEIMNEKVTVLRGQYGTS